MEIFNNEFVTLYNCDSRQIPIPDGSVDCVVTSPPYYGLRDYGINGQIGLEESPEKLIEPCILAGCPKDGVVLDPFVGSGTTAAVAQKYGRKSVGVDLNKEYLDIAVRRITSTQPVLL